MTKRKVDALEELDTQGLLRFLTNAKIPLSRAMGYIPALVKNSLTSESKIREYVGLKKIIIDSNDLRLLTAKKSKKIKEDFSHDTSLPIADDMVIMTNRAPYLLALTYRFLRRTTDYDAAKCLSLSQGVISLSSSAKARKLGLSTSIETVPTSSVVKVMGFNVPMSGDCAIDISDPRRTYDPLSTWNYLKRSIGEYSNLFNALDSVFNAHSIQECEKSAWRWYEDTRPDVSNGTSGWGQKGRLEISRIMGLIPVEEVKLEIKEEDDKKHENQSDEKEMTRVKVELDGD